MAEFPFLVKDPEGREIVLNRERWSHIVKRHGELHDKRPLVIRTIKSPDKMVKQSGRNDTYHYFLETDQLEYSDYICAVINIDKEFIVTAYPSDQKKA